MKRTKSTAVAPQRSYDTPLQEYEKKPTDIKVQIQVIEARNMASIGLFGSTNPYLGVYVTTDNFPRCKSKIIKKNLNPRWNEMLEVYVTNWKKAASRPMNIRFEAYGHNQNNPHDFLGQAVVYFKDHKALQTTTGKWTELWLPLEKRTSKDKVSGDLHVGLRCIDLSAKEDQEQDPRRMVDPEKNHKLQTNFKAAQRVSLDDPSNVGLPDYEWSNRQATEEELERMTLEERSKYETLKQDQARARQAKVGAQNMMDKMEYQRQGNAYAKNTKVTARNALDITEEQRQEHERNKGRKVGLDHGDDIGQFDMAYQTLDQQNKNRNKQKPATYKNTPSNIDPTRCMWRGKGLHDGIRVHAPTAFAVKSFDQDGTEIKEPRPQDVWQVEVVGPRDESLSSPATCTVKPDGLMDVQYTPDQPGLHMIHLHVNDKPIRNSPYQVWVHPVTDPSQSEAFGGPLIEHDVRKTRGPNTLMDPDHDMMSTPEGLDATNGPYKGKPITARNRMDLDAAESLDATNPYKGKPTTTRNPMDLDATESLDATHSPYKSKPTTAHHPMDLDTIESLDATHSPYKGKPITARNGVEHDTNEQLDQNTFPHHNKPIKANHRDPLSQMETLNQTHNPKHNKPITARFDPSAHGENVMDPSNHPHPGKSIFETDQEPTAYGESLNQSHALNKPKPTMAEWQNMPSGDECPIPSGPSHGELDQESIPHAIVNDPATFMVQARDTFNNRIYAGGDRVTATFDQPVKDLVVVDNDDGTYEVTFTPTSPGEYQANVLLNNQPVKNSPSRVLVKPRAEPQNTTVKVIGVPRAQEPVRIKVIANDWQGDPVNYEKGLFVKLNVMDPDRNHPQTFIAAVADEPGTWDAMFVARVPGEHRATVFLNDQPCTTIRIMAQPRAVPQMCLVQGPQGGDLVTGAHLPCSMTILARDQEGQPISEGGDEFKCTVDDQPVEVIDNNNGTYSASYRPDQPGVYRFDVTLNGIPISNSPQLVSITDGVSPEHCAASGPGLHRAYAHVPTSFVIQAKDQHGNDCNTPGLHFDVEVTTRTTDSNATDQPTVKRQYYKSPGQYPIQYTPMRPGMHQVSVSLNGNPIQNSPFMVSVKDQKIAPSAVMSAADGPNKGSYRKPYALKVRLKDSSGRPVRGGRDDVKVIAKSLNNKNDPPIEFTVNDCHNGTYDAVWLPQYVGEYDVQVNVNGQPMESFQHCVHIDMDLDEHSVASVRERTYKIQVCDTEGLEVQSLDDESRNGFKVHFYDEATDAITNHIMTNLQHVPGTGTFVVSYLIDRPGKYQMQVLFYEQVIAQVRITL